jgi:hypothetical protein
MSVGLPNGLSELLGPLSVGCDRVALFGASW